MRWLCDCENCGHQWFVTLAEDEDPDGAEVQCEICDSDQVTGVIAGYA